jgi:hypothetical protein
LLARSSPNPALVLKARRCVQFLQEATREGQNEVTKEPNFPARSFSWLAKSPAAARNKWQNSHNHHIYLFFVSLSFFYTTMPPKTTTPPVKADVAKKTCAVCGKGKAVNFKEETMDKIRAHFGTKKAKDQKACRSCNMKTMAAARKAAASTE